MKKKKKPKKKPKGRTPSREYFEILLSLIEAQEFISTFKLAKK